ncbi:hypothetical protein SMC26_39580 [Actinomadura fulvescens]|uniref:Uncharacterized protein n=1 Tax=Actinomadura fulvescens TaxID=46160 RepID=A0ABN3Q1P4_9ACTN
MDSYTFRCDLDRDLPEGKQARLMVGEDGEHVAFGFSDGAEEREIYLTPEDAANLAHLVAMLADVDGDQDTEDAPENALTNAVGCLSILVTLALVLALVALFR